MHRLWVLRTSATASIRYCNVVFCMSDSVWGNPESYHTVVRLPSYNIHQRTVRSRKKDHTRNNKESNKSLPPCLLSILCWGVYFLHGHTRTTLTLPFQNRWSRCGIGFYRPFVSTSCRRTDGASGIAVCVDVRR